MISDFSVTIGGQPIVWLEAEETEREQRAFTRAALIPGRALMILQAYARLPQGEVEVFAAPPAAEAASLLSGDKFGNAAFAFGGAVLAPFANRIRGRFIPETNEIATRVRGRPIRLVANGAGRADGAERFAIHGLILDRAVEKLEPWLNERGSGVRGLIACGSFGDRWLSELQLEIAWLLESSGLELYVTARNVGSELAPVGIGWHPYFNLPSGVRSQALMRLPAHERMLVNNYDEVLPTGALEQVVGTAYDFRGPEGVALGDLGLDDCFSGLERNAAGDVVCEVRDPLKDYGLRITTRSPHVTALQTFTTRDKPFVVIEPQFNWADPYGAEWGGRYTGMVSLLPREYVRYSVRMELFAPETG